MSGNKMHEMWPGVHPAVKGLRIAGIAVLGVIGAALFALVFGWLVMVLWNWVMPTVFHLGEISYWQAFGILVLAKLLFGAIGGGGGRHPRHSPWKGNPWRSSRHEGSHDDWRYYRRFWEEEGQNAFDEYVKKQKSGEGTIV
jgi:hypothetical protein